MQSQSHTVSEYRVYCLTENAFVAGWSPCAPTCCPNNNTHTIDPELTTIVDSVSSSTVAIASIAYGNVGGYYRADGGMITASSNVGSTTTVDIVYPIPVSAYGLTMIATASNIGDTIDVTTAPDTVVGVLTQAAAAGTTTFHVSPTVLQNIMVGFDVGLTDMAQHTENLGRVLSMDATGGTLTSELPLAADFATSTPVLMSLYIARGVPIVFEGKVKLGYAAMGAKPIPAGITNRLSYNNLTGGQKSVGYIFEYAY